MLAGIALVALITGQAPSKAELIKLRAGREWLFNATNERKDSGYFALSEGSPDGIYFPIGRSDRLYYCSISVDEYRPKNDRFVVTCWQREGKKPRRLWQIKLLAGKQAAHGTLLTHACSSSFEFSLGSSDPKTGKDKMFEHAVDGFHPDRTAATWKLAQKEFESTQPLVRYHLNWHGDVTLGNYVELHGDGDREFGREFVSPPDIFVVPQAEIKLLSNRKH